jgi:hypothetical protein
LSFWAAVRPFLALHDLKPVLARCKRAEITFKTPCCRPSPFVVVVWRYLLDYDPGAKTYPHPGDRFSAAGSRNGLETARVTTENAKPAEITLMRGYLGVLNLVMMTHDLCVLLVHVLHVLV